MKMEKKPMATPRKREVITLKKTSMVTAKKNPDEYNVRNLETKIWNELINVFILKKYVKAINIFKRKEFTVESIKKRIQKRLNTHENHKQLMLNKFEKNTRVCFMERFNQIACVLSRMEKTKYEERDFYTLLKIVSVLMNVSDKQKNTIKRELDKDDKSKEIVYNVLCWLDDYAIDVEKVFRSNTVIDLKSFCSEISILQHKYDLFLDQRKIGKKEDW